MPERLPNAAQRARAEELEQAWLEGALTDDGAEELRSLIELYPSLARRCIGQLHYDQMLRDLSNELPVGFAALDPADDLTDATPQTRTRRWARPSWGIVALGLFGIVGWIVTATAGLRGTFPGQQIAGVKESPYPGDQSHSTSATKIAPPIEHTSDAVAIVSRTLSARWSGDDKVPEKGDLLSPGRIRLSHGLLSVDFFRGARLALEAPCDVEIISRERIVFHSGKLAASVPQLSREFLIETPHGSILDPSPGFGVFVHPTQTDVHVFEGEVTLPSVDSARLKPGDAVELADGKIRRSFTADESLFVTVGKLEKLHALASASKYVKWKLFTDHLCDDPDLLVQFDFSQSNAESEFLLENRAVHSNLSHGVIVGCQSAAGRWPEQKGLGFQSLSDRVRIHLSGEFPAITLSTWVCVHSLPESYAGLLMCDGMQAGNLHWQLTKKGTVLLCYGNLPITKDKRTEAETGVMLTPEILGKWIHLAIVLDSTRQRVTHYFNGKPIWSDQLAMNHQVRIGDANLGNWTSADIKSYPIRNLCGVLDEFTIHRRPLTDDEIQKIYEVGLPNTIEGPPPQIPNYRAADIQRVAARP